MAVKNKIWIFKNQMKKYASDKTIKEKLEIWFIKDHENAIKIRAVNLTVKLLTCIFYIIQVILDTHSQELSLLSNDNETTTETASNVEELDWLAVAFVNRPPYIRYIQIVLAFYGFFESVLRCYLNYNEKLISKALNPYFIVELVCTVPWFFELVVPQAHSIFIPVFLNCWLVKRNLDVIFKDYNNMHAKTGDSIIGQHLVSLINSLLCLIFTCSCGFQHLHRASLNRNFSIFDSFYVTIITLSTVGYGDITPKSWPTKLFVVVMIIAALVILPSKIEQLISLWIERKNSTGSYSPHLSTNKHIVVCLTHIQHDFILHFLKEFYAHRKNQSINTVLLTSSEVNVQLKQLLNSPLWHSRVFYIYGSAFRNADLVRAKVNKAKAVFIISPRGSTDRDMEDQHTILRSWAIKDFAPHVPQFVQLFRMENKMHLSFVENLVCEDEFIYAILANNCLCAGISTLITLLMHKTTQSEKRYCLDDWQELYGKLAGNELHSITAENSKFFQELIGKPFPIASFMAHEKYNVCLVAIGTKKFKKLSKASLQFETEIPMPSFFKMSMNNDHEENDFSDCDILINPGSRYIIQPEDICIYISLVKEENYDFKVVKATVPVPVPDIKTELLGPPLTSRLTVWEKLNEKVLEDDINYSSFEDGEGDMFSLSKRVALNQLSVDYTGISMTQHTKRYNQDIDESELVVDKPTNSQYIGCFPIKCKLLRNSKDICCMRLDQPCEHRINIIKTSDYSWHNKCIILAAEQATNGLFSFILPLRAKARSTHRMKPIIILFNKKPSNEFLQSISSFPLVFWLEGSVTDINVLLKAGILHSDALVVVSNSTEDEVEDESLYDSSNIFAIQNIYRLFPRVKVISELRKASNIRFMKFRGKDMEKEKSSKLMYMYRTPFASGNVFSASMIDTLLYQAFGKPFLVDFFRLLIGVSQTEGSGNLTSILINSDDMWIKTYGNLYKKLVLTTGEIPIGIYRTLEKGTNKEFIFQNIELKKLVLSKMNQLKMNPDTYDSISGNSTVGKLSYVLINPPNEYLLQQNDIIYLLRPGNSDY